MNKEGRVVVIDDEPNVLEAWGELLDERFEVTLFSDPLKGRDFLSQEETDVVLLDLRMPGMDGLSFLSELKTSRNTHPPETIVITGHGTIQLAVEAMQLGAFDFLCKPVDDLEAAIRRINTAVERRRLREMNSRLSRRLAAFESNRELVGETGELTEIKKLVANIASSSAPVLICGESGTGKELVARAIHQSGDRKKKPFVPVNCAAISASLLDSELFGHAKGAFTGAQTDRKGLFEAANGGVIFLDEIGDISLETQVRLLRTLQEGEIRPVGSTKTVTLDVRVVAATNVNLKKAMASGAFREDLYYRISTFKVDLPPLRERRTDVPLIAQHLLDKYSHKNGIEMLRLSDGALELLSSYTWPGNVRELNNVIEYAATLCEGVEIGVAHLPAFVSASQHVPPSLSTQVIDGTCPPFRDARNALLYDFERRYLDDLLVTTGGNISEASRRSRVDRSNLRRLIKKYGLKPADYCPS